MPVWVMRLRGPANRLKDHVLHLDRELGELFKARVPVEAAGQGDGNPHESRRGGKGVAHRLQDRGGDLGKMLKEADALKKP